MFCYRLVFFIFLFFILVIYCTGSYTVSAEASCQVERHHPQTAGGGRETQTQNFQVQYLHSHQAYTVHNFDCW